MPQLLDVHVVPLWKCCFFNQQGARRDWKQLLYIRSHHPRGLYKVTAVEVCSVWNKDLVQNTRGREVVAGAI